MSKLGAGNIVRVDFSVKGRCGYGSVAASNLKGKHKSKYSIKELCATAGTLKTSAEHLKKQGVFDLQLGKACITGRMKKADYEKLFSTTLENKRFPNCEGSTRQFYRHFWPSSDASWNMPSLLQDNIDDAYIQRPHIYFAPSLVPPAYREWHLRTNSVEQLLDVVEAKKQFKVSGKTVKVAMLDTGFDFSHPYYKNSKVKFTVHKASDSVTSTRLDENGHGTAMMMNLLAVAPDIELIPIKLDRADDAFSGASLTEGFIKARSLNPDIITMSAGYDLKDAATQQQIASLPNSLKAFETEIKEAVADGILVIAAAGNGQVAFPAMMPEVLAVGGVYVDDKDRHLASDLASGYKSKIYNKAVPDVSGLVGNKPYGRYIAMPVPRGSVLDRNTGSTSRRPDAWVLSSGTSAAAPQIAGICALALERKSSLKPTEIISALKSSTLPVSGKFNTDSNNGSGFSADGRGLVNTVKFLNTVI